MKHVTFAPVTPWLFALASLTACSSSSSVAGAPDGDVVLDGGGDESGSKDDVGSADGCTAPATYSALGDKAKWKTSELKALDALTSIDGYVFDGRYIYVLSGGSPKVVRLDTQSDFTTVTFDLTTVDVGADGFNAGVFDGRYVYLGSSYSGLLARLDTKAAFDAPSSWTTFDVAKIDAAATGFLQPAFDGKNVYFLTSSRLVQFDTTAAAFNPDSVHVLDLRTIDPKANRYLGTAFDGHYLYLVPNTSTAPVMRYDTTASLKVASSWSTYDPSTLVPTGYGYAGAVFDGRYVYLVPQGDDKHLDGTVVRYDTTAPFRGTSAWTTFDTSTLDSKARGFRHGTFDGRYVYFAPDWLDPVDSMSFAGTVTRLDTTAAFDAAASWSTFDVTTLSADAKGFAGAAFDGQSVYLVPAHFHTVAKFEARSPACKTSGWNRSFW